jgi:DNA-binding NarL/FixJ family response regulator
MDDHNLVRHGVASLLRLDGRYLVVGEASNGEEGLQLLESVATDLVLLDLSMPRLNGIETMRRMAKRFPRIRVLVLSMYNDEQFVAQTLKDGARGYILKNAMDGELFQALETVLRGNRYVSPSIDITNVHSRELEPLDLTVREREVLQLIVEGHTTLEIADMLTISPHTAAHHRSNLMQKLDAHSQIELVQIAAGRGLVLMPRRL